ncbi:hypothetical protein [Epilithonimonas caeni]|uniref:hypothetical protein n=1 Tax=Epilithonimonas caeni TaxID=365343 RepID=UPI00040B4F2E|nr:hypothetical protein [Epilithonimonas caeni]
MCDCKNKVGFKDKLREAGKKTKDTGILHVVYVHKATDSIFIRKESDLNDELNICCYFTPDGKEVLYVKKTVENSETIKDDKTTPKKKTAPKPN